MTPLVDLVACCQVVFGHTRNSCSRKVDLIILFFSFLKTMVMELDSNNLGITKHIDLQVNGILVTLNLLISVVKVILNWK